MLDGDVGRDPSGCGRARRKAQAASGGTSSPSGEGLAARRSRAFSRSAGCTKILNSAIPSTVSG